MKISRRKMLAGLGTAGLAHLGPFGGELQAAEPNSPAFPRKAGQTRVALIKAYPQFWNLEYNFNLFETLAAAAAARGAQLVCTPECFLDGYAASDQKNFSQEKFKQISQNLDDSPYIQNARKLAQRLQVHVVFGFTALAEKGSYNSAALIDDTGQILGLYHKTHLEPDSHDCFFLPGDEFKVWQTKLGPIGIMICADRRWPESARTLKVLGAKVIMTPTYGMAHDANEWWMRTRSYENEIYICFAHPAVALITDPAGEVAAKLVSNIPDVLLHDIDLTAATDKMFNLRRPEIYRLK